MHHPFFPPHLLRPQETKKLQTSRAIVLVLRKKEARSEYWPRLTKEKPNRNWVKTDFSKVGPGPSAPSALAAYCLSLCALLLPRM